MKDRALLVASVLFWVLALGASALMSLEDRPFAMASALSGPAATGPVRDRAQATVAPSLKPLDRDRAIFVNSGRPFDAGPIASQAFGFTGSSVDHERALDCLAAAGYYEAGDDPDGQRAVVQVVLNRVRSAAYPATVCGVVFQGQSRKTGCQFTFTCDGSMRRMPSSGAWARARTVAAAALNGSIDRRVGTATHYHANYVVPYWSHGLSKIAVVGPHIFYRSSGRAHLTADRRLGSEPEIALLAPLQQGAGQRVGGSPPQEPVGGSDPGLIAARDDGDPTLAVASPADPTHFLLADATRPAGRFAVQALDLCKGQPDCRVVGYATEDSLARNRLQPWHDRERPAFLFVRDRAGSEFALWDCAKHPRIERRQCLPESSVRLGRLMRPGDAGQDTKS